MSPARGRPWWRSRSTTRSCIRCITRERRLRNNMRATSIIVFSILLSVSQAPALRAESPKPTPEEPPHRSELSVEVLSDEDIQPIRDAVVFVTAEGNGVDFEKSAHTNGKGVASFLEVPRVKVTVQVTA